LAGAAPWLPYYRSSPHGLLRLFCFPYAGGGASVFRAWRDELPAQIEVCALQLPGRENRLAEAPIRGMESLVDALAPVLGAYLDKPFALFGHSMGGRVAFELARRLRAEHGVEPRHLLVSACRAPQVPNDDDRTHGLPDDEFVDALRRLRGVPEEVLRNRELREIFLPVLRADFTLFETTRYRPEAPLGCPITAFGGTEDTKLRRERLEPWRAQTRAGFTLTMIPGDHFYLQTQRATLLRHVAAVLYPLVT
jgi:medium-chain acyl-[acyl-carrier-protein] hydrolase